MQHCSPLRQQPQRMQQQPSPCPAALPAALDGLAAAHLQQDQVAAAITVVVALAWVKVFDVLTNTGVLEQVRSPAQKHHMGGPCTHPFLPSPPTRVHVCPCGVFKLLWCILVPCRS